MKSGFLEKLVARLDRVEPGEVQQIVLRLIEEKGFLENVFEALHEGIIILDSDGCIQFLNHAASRFFGLEPSKSLGQKISNIIRGLENIDLMTDVLTVSRDIEIFYPEHRKLNFYLSPIDPTKNHHLPLGYVMLIRDLTRTHEEIEQTLESERLNALTLLAAGVAHEIGNPLNSLDIHLQLMERKIKRINASERKGLNEHLHTARQEIQRLDTILKQFLHAVRPTTPLREANDLNHLLKQTLDLLKPEITSRNILIEAELSPNLPKAYVDPSQFQQVFYNLIKNAYQAVSTENGILKISTASTETDFIISVSDNGNGISPEHMGSLFEPYRTTKSSGTGLGLLIVRRIVREHGGEIEIQSLPEQGTRILIYLPHSAPSPRLLPSPSIHA